MLNHVMPNPSPPGAQKIAAILASAGRHVAARQYQAGHEACLEALKLAPDSGEAYLLLGVIAGDHSNHVKAIELLDRAAALLSPRTRPLALAYKARNFTALNRRSESIAAAEAAAELNPTDAQTLDNLGVVFTRAGLHERAAPYYERATAVQGTPGRFYNLGAALQFLGRFEDARAAYSKCIAMAPHHGQAWSSLTQITRATRETNDIPALEAAFAARARDAEDALNLGHALAKTFEDIGDPAQAMAWLDRAKAGRRAKQPYDPAFDDALFEAATRSANVQRGGGFDGAAPIFVVGMPRTGTTLVDRILSSHSAVASAGELTDVCRQGFVVIALRQVADADAVGERPHALGAGDLGRFTLKSTLPLGSALAGGASRAGFARRARFALGAWFALLASGSGDTGGA